MQSDQNLISDGNSIKKERNGAINSCGVGVKGGRMGAYGEKGGGLRGKKL